MKSLPFIIMFLCFGLLNCTSVLGQHQDKDEVRRSLFIQQVGNYNQFTAETFSETSNIAAFQIGTQNTSYLHLRAFDIQGTLLQTGNENSFIHINSSVSRNLQTTVVQQGYNQNLLLLGGNSLSNTMKIAMRGNSQTIVVRNLRPQR